MTATLKLETMNYQVFDMGYGVIILNRNIDNINAKNGFNNVLMQGDDANNFLTEVDSALSKNIKTGFIDYWLSGYDEVMELMEEEDLNKIGITVSKNKKLKIQ
ncbi:hypothetical protein GW796_10945 [archaeon]|nr:hypothetical protein [archaeon]